MSISILFVTEKPTDRVAKISAALREIGICTSVMTLAQKNNVDFANCIDFMRYVKTHSEAIDIIRRHPSRQVVYLPVGQLEFSKAILGSGKPYIIDYKDVIEATHPGKSSINHELRYLLERASGLIYRDLQADYHEKHAGYILPKKRLFFPDFCWPISHLPTVCDSPEKGLLSIVFIGNYPSEVLHPERESNSLLHTAKFLINKGFTVGYYPFPHGIYDFSQYIELQKLSGGRFSINKPLHPLALHYEIQKYAWGGVVHQYRVFPETFKSIWFDDLHLHVAGAARLWEYVSAGVPLLYMNDRLNRRLLCGEDNGLYFNQSAVEKLKGLTLGDYAKKKVAMSRFRLRSTISRHIHKLLSFIIA